MSDHSVGRSTILSGPARVAVSRDGGATWEDVGAAEGLAWDAVTTGGEDVPAASWRYIPQPLRFSLSLDSLDYRALRRALPDLPSGRAPASRRHRKKLKRRRR